VYGEEAEHTVIITSTAWLLGGILCLLLLWRQHQRKVESGLIAPVDLLNPSGIRWYLYAIPDDLDVCSSCREANGTAFLARAAARKDFVSPAAQCTTPDKCLGLFMPFSDRWPEADDLLAQLKTGKAESRRLAPAELSKLLAVEWQPDALKFDGANIHLLSGFLQESSLPLQAIRSYGAVLERATLPRDKALLMPAYIRLTGVLARRGNPREAIRVIEHFEKRVARAEAGTFTPTGKQRRALSTMKPYLYALIDDAADKQQKPATIGAQAEDSETVPPSDTAPKNGPER
jgi:hypothetical protein